MQDTFIKIVKQSTTKCFPFVKLIGIYIKMDRNENQNERRKKINIGKFDTYT